MSSRRRRGPSSVDASPIPTRTADLTGACTEVARVVAGVRDGQLGDPTPCADTPVAALLDHLVSLTLAFRLAARKTPPGPAPRASAESLVPDWRDRLTEQLAALAGAWRDRSAWEGSTEVGGMSLPGGVAGLVALNEVLVHGWDLAAATGQPYAPDERDAVLCLAFGTAFAEASPEVRDAIYGPAVPVPDGAPAFARLLGHTGRDPGWRPPGG
jgi:uncharacterized protein (TIGR03086 family)